MIEVKNLSKSYGSKLAVDGISFTAGESEILGFLGPNGAGKSTLMKCLFGIYAKNAGTIVLDGKEVDFKSSKEALENGVAMVHQEQNNDLTRSVMEKL